MMLLQIVGLSAQSNKKIPSDKPKIVIGIIVSQFRHDYISRYWDSFSEDGFKKLVGRGTHCKNTSYNYQISDKGVGTATIVTGTYPSGHGIVAQSWYNDLKEQITPAIYDKNAQTLGGNFEVGKCSPHQLLGTTFSDELNLSNKFKSKIISVSLEPASSVLSAGHTANAAYWFDIQAGNFVSSSYYTDSLPIWVNNFNNKNFPDIYFEKTWNTLLPISSYTASLDDKNDYELGYKNQTTFPYELEKIAKIFKKKEKYAIMNATPYGDNLIKDFATHAIVNEALGTDNTTDFLFLNFTSIEQIGNLFGPLSVEMQDAVIRLDREIGHFLNFIEEQIGIENSLIFFTAEHGLGHRPEYLSANKIPSGYFNSTSAISLLNSYLNNLYGKGDWVKQYHAQQIYLNRTLINSAELSLEEFQKSVADLLLQFHGVANTLTATSLLNTNYTNGEFAKIQNGFSQKRSGDVVIKLNNGWVEKHGKTISSYGTDSRVPLIWYGWKTKRKTIHSPVSLIDIAPTISVLLETSYPSLSSGVPIEEMLR